MKIEKDDFLMIWSHFIYKQRYDEGFEKKRWRCVSHILSKYLLSIHDLHDFQDNREEEFVNKLIEEIDATFLHKEGPKQDNLKRGEPNSCQNYDKEHPICKDYELCYECTNFKPK